VHLAEYEASKPSVTSVQFFHGNVYINIKNINKMDIVSSGLWWQDFQSYICIDKCKTVFRLFVCLCRFSVSLLVSWVRMSTQLRIHSSCVVCRRVDFKHSRKPILIYCIQVICCVLSIQSVCKQMHSVHCIPYYLCEACFKVWSWWCNICNEFMTGFLHYAENCSYSRDGLLFGPCRTLAAVLHLLLAWLDDLSLFVWILCAVPANLHWCPSTSNSYRHMSCPCSVVYSYGSKVTACFLL